VVISSAEVLAGVRYRAREDVEERRESRARRENR